MHPYSRTHLDDRDLLKSAEQSNGRENAAIAGALADIAEVDARQLYRPLGYDSTSAYLVRELHRSEDSAYKRIHAARAAHAFPEIYPMLADGRLNLSSVVTLAPKLRPETAAELLAAAAKKSRAELLMLLAERFPQPDVPTTLREIGRAAQAARADGEARAHRARGAGGERGGVGERRG